MTARFSVLKNVLSGRFNARDDFWVVQVAKKPSQLVFVPSMAISQQDRMAVFGVSDRGSFPSTFDPEPRHFYSVFMPHQTEPNANNALAVVIRGMLPSCTVLPET